MKQKVIATIFLFILLSAGCRMGDPILGRWELIGGSPVGLGGTETVIMEFKSDGTCYCVYPGKWQRLDDSRVTILLNALARLRGSPEIVIVKIEGNVATFTHSSGTVQKWKRQGLW